MRSKLLLSSIFFLIFFGNTNTASAIGSASGTATYWSVIRTASVYDSVKTKLQEAPTPLEVKALKDYLKALQFRQQLKASDNFPAVFPTSAGIYKDSINTDSLSAFDQLLSLYKALGDKRGQAGALRSYGVHQAVKGDMDRALIYFEEAAELNKELIDRPALIRNYFSIAGIHRYRGNFEESVRYNEYIVDIALLLRNNTSLGEAYMNLANLWSLQKKYKEAEFIVMKKALPLYYYKLQNKVGAMKCYDQLGEIYSQQKRYSEAKWFNIQSNMIARKINNSAGIVNSLINLSHVKMSIGHYQLALRDLKEAEQISVSKKFSHRLVEIKNDLSKVYTALGNTSMANSALSEFTALKNTLLSTVY